MIAGTSANFNGGLFEDTIVPVLARHRVQYQRQRCIGNGIYGAPIMCDFYLPQYHLAIECKWQDSAGSVDEKLPYMIENAVHFFECSAMRTVIVIGGRGFRPGALLWLRAQNKRPAIAGVFDSAEFISWSAKTFRA